MSLLLGSCVSVELPGGKVTSAKNVEFSEPSEPFQKIKSKSADRAWQSSKTGNTISYISECGSTSDASLQTLETDSLSALNKLQILKTETATYNGRESRQSVSAGTIDGVPVALALVVFKKNGCNYTLSYGGVEKQFNSELPVFESFKANFKAP
ncbi:hypothetical protein B9G69_016960 [Bdellovibrio sp. SKB1291214]|uniref:hypothetical protein n=1 Tax=Bdellovibrio sp. SKB1291214 TaxID=1732569 RepID=UPI0020CB9B1F|nr:hypothetical protein [Bdellovibrio sp. SKB1291214]UYL08735.1 hypothetical protein B9G69_016960 [Bdellovibrio sp. SKB1291214]